MDPKTISFTHDWLNKWFLKSKAHHIIRWYDKRQKVENL